MAEKAYKKLSAPKLIELFETHTGHAPQTLIKTPKFPARFKFRNGFYYRHGGDADWWCETCSKKLELIGCKFTVLSSQEHWNPWPKDSYWEVIVDIHEWPNK